MLSVAGSRVSHCTFKVYRELLGHVQERHGHVIPTGFSLSTLEKACIAECRLGPLFRWQIHSKAVDHCILSVGGAIHGVCLHSQVLE